MPTTCPHLKLACCLKSRVNKITAVSAIPSHYSDVIMGAIASQINSLTIVPNRLFRRRSKKTSKLRVNGLCVGNSPGTGEFPAQTASNVENVSIWWRHHAFNVSWYTILSILMNTKPEGQKVMWNICLCTIIWRPLPQLTYISWTHTYMCYIFNT